MQISKWQNLAKYPIATTFRLPFHFSICTLKFAFCNGLIEFGPGGGEMGSVGQSLRRQWKLMVVWAVIAGTAVLGVRLGWDRWVVAAGVVVFGFLTQAFTGLMGLIGTIPGIGPPIVKIITLPLFLLLNGVSYLVTFFALRRGYRWDVLRSRIVAGAFLVGMILGFLLGRALS